MPRSRMACYMSLVLGGASALNAITIFGKGYIRTQV